MHFAIVEHASDFDIIDEDEAYVLTAKFYALTAYRLLKDNARVAKKVKEQYRPIFANKEEYIDFMEKFYSVEEAEIQ